MRDKEETLALVLATIERVGKIKLTEAQYDDNLLRLGIDSIKAIQVINDLEDELDVVIDDSQLRHFTSIRAIAAYIETMPND